ncbi:DNA polymerase III subunit beta [Variovorax rhizosphaerae]|uniref:Beta sliding clamp n=1 Tax=Variovorax rhizosphaerae TaxID=1836200 RepID=A0ABU8WVG4_9BURK
MLALDAGQRRTLAGAMTTLTAVVERTGKLPIADCVLIRVADGVLALTTTGLERQADFRMPLAATPGEAPAFSVAVDAGRLEAFLDGLGDMNAPLTAVVEDKLLRMRCAGSRASIPLVAAEDFPLLPSSPGATVETVSAPALADLFAQVAYAMAAHDIRYYLNATQLTFKAGSIALTATDGHRVGRAWRSIERTTGGEEPLAALVPRKTATVLARLLASVEGDASVSIGANLIKVSAGAYTLTSRLVDGRYPDVERVIPTSFVVEVEADRAALLAALSRARVAGDGKTGVAGPVVRLQTGPGLMTLTVAGATGAGLEAVEEFECDVEDGVEFVAAFTLSYLADAVSAVTTPRVALKITSANIAVVGPVVGAGEDAQSQHVAMGRRV